MLFQDKSIFEILQVFTGLYNFIFLEISKKFRWKSFRYFLNRMHGCSKKCSYKVFYIFLNATLCIFSFILKNPKSEYSQYIFIYILMFLF